jgi:hypothetical protein
MTCNNTPAASDAASDRKDEAPAVEMPADKEMPAAAADEEAPADKSDGSVLDADEVMLGADDAECVRQVRETVAKFTGYLNEKSNALAIATKAMATFTAYKNTVNGTDLDDDFKNMEDKHKNAVKIAEADVNDGRKIAADIVKTIRKAAAAAAAAGAGAGAADTDTDTKEAATAAAKRSAAGAQKNKGILERYIKDCGVNNDDIIVTGSTAIVKKPEDRIDLDGNPRATRKLCDDIVLSIKTDLDDARAKRTSDGIQVPAALIDVQGNKTELAVVNVCKPNKGKPRIFMDAKPSHIKNVSGIYVLYARNDIEDPAWIFVPEEFANKNELFGDNYAPKIAAVLDDPKNKRLNKPMIDALLDEDTKKNIHAPPEYVAKKRKAEEI